MCSKSANYCHASRAKRDAVVLLCDVSYLQWDRVSSMFGLQVSLGHTQDLLHGNSSANHLPKGKFSTKVLGKVAPDPAQNHTL